MGGGSVGTDDSFDCRAWRKTNPCEENKLHVICMEWVRKPKSSHSTHGLMELMYLTLIQLLRSDQIND